MLEGTKNVTNNIANSGVEMYNNTASAASNALSSGMNSVTNSVEVVKNFSETYINNFSTVFFALIGLIIVASLVGYGLYYLILENIGQQRIQIEGTEIPIICNETKEFKTKYGIMTQAEREALMRSQQSRNIKSKYSFDIFSIW